MKYIQTFWTRDVPEEQLPAIGAGWLAPEYHWMSWALSCLQLKKIFGHVELVTDQRGKYILSDVFHLPYDSISTGLDIEMTGCPPDAWALAKIFAYRSQSEPFLHFDSDFYLWKMPQQDILHAQVVAQNLEKDLPFYQTAFESIQKYLAYIPQSCGMELWKNISVYACNAGIFGGSNLSFIHEYCDAAIRFVKRNKDCFGFAGAANLNFVFEQYFLKYLSDKRKVPVTFLSDHVQEDAFYGTYLHFTKLPHQAFIHPVGGHKKSREICDHVSSQLRMRYPGCYYHILDVMQKRRLLSSVKVFSTAGSVQTKGSPPASDSNATYERTIAALHHLENMVAQTAKSAISGIISRLPDQSDKTIKQMIADLPVQEREKKLIIEVFVLEYRKQELAETVFSKRGASLYRRECETYEILQENFSRSGKEKNEIIVTRNPQLRRLPVSRNWICKIPELTGQMIRERFGEKETQKAEMAMVVNIARQEVDEYYLEPIDSIIVRLCRKQKALSQIIAEMQDYFSPEEVEEHYESYCRLVEETVKNLLYLKILIPRTK